MNHKIWVCRRHLQFLPMSGKSTRTGKSVIATVNLPLIPTLIGIAPFPSSKCTELWLDDFRVMNWKWPGWPKFSRFERLLRLASAPALPPHIGELANRDHRLGWGILAGVRSWPTRACDNRPSCLKPAEYPWQYYWRMEIHSKNCLGSTVWLLFSPGTNNYRKYSRNWIVWPTKYSLNNWHSWFGERRIKVNQRITKDYINNNATFLYSQISQWFAY